MEYLQTIIEWLTGIYLHPLVTLTVVVVIALGRQRFEASYLSLAGQLRDQAAKATPETSGPLMLSAKDAEMKANSMGNYVFLVACVLALVAQFAFYWPTSGQARAICFVMSVVQVGCAEAVYFYVNKWGLMDKLGGIIQKKMDTAGGA